jgi:phosphopantetheinyl transferase (holo-ACP synthase)
MTTLETYLKELAEIRSSGAAQICHETGVTTMHLSLSDESNQPLAVMILEK